MTAQDSKKLLMPDQYPSWVVFSQQQQEVGNLKAGEEHNDPVSRKGGFRASLFIFAFASLENMGFIANVVSLALYFNLQMHFDVSTSANTFTNLMGSTFLLSIICGFVSDTYITRFNTILIFGTFGLLVSF